MVRSLAEDKLSYSPAQLNVLSQQIRVGDLTPVLQLYEEDIKKPFTSAVTGTLLRGLFIQIQKAKVCTLLSSQNLMKDSHTHATYLGGHRPSPSRYRQTSQIPRTHIRVRRRRTCSFHFIPFRWVYPECVEWGEG